MLSDKTIREILCAAIKNRVLIITDTDDESRAIRHEIADFVMFRLSSEVFVKVHSEGVNVGGYEPIFVYDLKKWNGCYRCYPFSGAVMVTDRKITDIKNIAEGAKK